MIKINKIYNNLLIILCKKAKKKNLLFWTNPCLRKNKKKTNKVKRMKKVDLFEEGYSVIIVDHMIILI